MVHKDNKSNNLRTNYSSPWLKPEKIFCSISDFNHSSKDFCKCIK